MMNQEILSRITAIETRLNTMDERFDAQQVKNEHLAKLSVLMEMSIETNKLQTVEIKEMREHMTKQNEVIVKVSENLSFLNDGIKDLGNRVDSLEKENNQKGKIDVLQVLTDVGKWVLFTGATSGIVYLATQYFGK